MASVLLCVSSCGSDKNGDEPEVVYENECVWELNDPGDLGWERANQIIEDMNEQLSGLKIENINEFYELAEEVETAFKETPGNYKMGAALSLYFKEGQNLPDGWSIARLRKYFILNHGICSTSNVIHLGDQSNFHGNYRVFASGPYASLQELGKYYNVNVKRMCYPWENVETYARSLMMAIVDRLNSGETKYWDIEVHIYNIDNNKQVLRLGSSVNIETKEWSYVEKPLKQE